MLFLGCVTHPHAQRQVLEPRKSLIAYVSTFLKICLNLNLPSFLILPPAESSLISTLCSSHDVD